MTLEQRIEALEKAVASLTLPSAKSEELAKMMQDTVSEVIRNSLRPGGEVYAALKQAAGKKDIFYAAGFEIKC